MIKRKFARAASGAAAGSLSVLFLVLGDSAADAAREAMHLAAVHVVPSLFPYMVITSVMISLDLLAPIYRHIPTERIFGLPRASAPVIITGMTGGFPIGAVGSCKLCECGKISKSDAGRLCALSLNTSPAFILGVIGGMWGRKYALFLLSAQIIVSVLLGILFAGRRFEIGEAAHVRSDGTHRSITETLCISISDAAISSVGICGYIVFFKVTSAVIGAVFPQISDIVYVLFEFSSGVALGAEQGGLYGICLTGFAVGFAGFSVFMQTVSLTEKIGIPFLPIFIRKLAVGVILAALSAIYYTVYTPSSASVTGAYTEGDVTHPIILLLCVMLVSALVARRLSRSKYFSRRY